jgi:hypothetical protein
MGIDAQHRRLVSAGDPHDHDTHPRATDAWGGISFCSEVVEDDATFVGGFTETGGGERATSNCACPAGASAFCYRP